jgi:hypothetical protein
MATYSGLLRDFTQSHAQYIRLSVAVTDTYTLSVWARMTGEATAALAKRSATKATREAWGEEAERWQRTASDHHRQHNLFAHLEAGTPLLLGELE